MIPRFRLVWHRVSIYLPVLLMGLLALGTYWLVHTSPAPRAAQGAQSLRHEPDYFMRGFSLSAYDALGRIKSEVSGSEIRHYPDNDMLEIDRPQILAFKPNGRRATASAELARAKGDGSEVELIGNAVMVRERTAAQSGPALPQLEFRSQYLHVDVDAQRVKSHRPVSLTRGQERLSGDAFEYSDSDKALELRGHVILDLAPNARKTGR